MSQRKMEQDRKTHTSDKSLEQMLFNETCHRWFGLWPFSVVFSFMEERGSRWKSEWNWGMEWKWEIEKTVQGWL